MTEYLKQLVQQLVSEPNEQEWLEFKENFHSPEEIGERISALANGACLCNKRYVILFLVLKTVIKALWVQLSIIKNKKLKVMRT